MDFASRPITEFYKHCLSAAKSEGFLWVVSLLARDADVDGLYDNLQRAWHSLDSITGKHFLFIFAGKENKTHEDRWKSRIIDRRESWAGAYNDYVSFMNQDLDLREYTRYDWRCDPDKNMQKIAENQTSAINSLRDYFSIYERDIPCLVFTSTTTNKSIILPIGNNNIYYFFKRLFNGIDVLLKDADCLTEQISACADEKRKIEGNLDQIARNTDCQIVSMRNYWLSNAQNYAEKDHILRCINNLEYVKSHLEIHSRKLRGKVNSYISLVKQYEERNGKAFDPEVIINEESERVDRKTELKDEHSMVNQKLDYLRCRYSQILDEIEISIRNSKMTIGGGRM